MTYQRDFNRLLVNAQLSADFEQRVLLKIKRYRRRQRISVALLALLICTLAIILSTKNSDFSPAKDDYYARRIESDQNQSRPRSYALEELHFVANSEMTSYLYEEYYLKQNTQNQL